MRTKPQTFYDLVSQDQRYKIAVGSPSPKTIENYDKTQHLLKFALRPYQIEALSAFQLFWKDGFDSRSLKEKTLQEAKNDEEKIVRWHKVGFEMATGLNKNMKYTLIDKFSKREVEINREDVLALLSNTTKGFREVLERAEERSRLGAPQILKLKINELKIEN